MKGQIWIETAMYTLIGLAIIGMVLAFAMPKIEASQEKAIVDQTLTAFESLNNVINDVIATGPGNTRTYEVQFKKGEFAVDSQKNIVSFSLKDMKSPYSQPNRTIESGMIKIKTLKTQKNYEVNLNMNYTSLANIVLDGNEAQKTYSAAPLAYKFLITNNGTDLNNRIVIDILDK